MCPRRSRLTAVEASDAGLGADGVIHDEPDETDDTWLSLAVAEVLVSTYGTEVT
jgi:hypothetical protein